MVCADSSHTQIWRGMVVVNRHTSDEEAVAASRFTPQLSDLAREDHQHSEVRDYGVSLSKNESLDPAVGIGSIPKLMVPWKYPVMNTLLDASSAIP